VWIFQDGHRRPPGLFTANRDEIVCPTADPHVPAVAFGLVDGLRVSFPPQQGEGGVLPQLYNAALDRIGPSSAAVASSPPRRCSCLRFSSLFALSAGVSFIKLFWCGLALAIAVDATLVRRARWQTRVHAAGAWRTSTGGRARCPCADSPPTQNRHRRVGPPSRSPSRTPVG